MSEREYCTARQARKRYNYDTKERLHSNKTTFYLIRSPQHWKALADQWYEDKDSILRSGCLLDPDERQRDVDANDKSAGNAQRLQLSATTPHHREVVSRGGHQAFVRHSDGCANAETSVAGAYPADACRPPSAPCGVGAGPTNWTALTTWQLTIGPASRRPPRMGTRQPIPLLSTGKPLRSATNNNNNNNFYLYSAIKSNQSNCSVALYNE